MDPRTLRRPLIVLIRTLALGALFALGACVTQEPRPDGPLPAEIVPRADNIGMNLRIDRVDGRIVNVPEATLFEIEPGPHLLRVQVEYKPTSAGALIWGLSELAVLVREVGAEEATLEVQFTADPGKRYHLNGDVEDGKPTIWIVDDQTDEVVSF